MLFEHGIEITLPAKAKTERQIARREVRQTLRTNGYPCKYTNPPKPTSQRELPTFTKFTSLPCIQGTTEKIRRILNKVGVKVAMKPIRTIGQYLPSPKDPITTDKITCVVYEVPCKNRDFVYVGQTKRDLNSRLKEHQRAIKQQKPENSALCEHAILFDHVINWANSRILKTESNFSKRLTAESWFILSRPKAINRSDGESFPIVYRSLL